MRHSPNLVAMILLLCTVAGAARAGEVTIDSTDALRSAISRTTPGTTILPCPRRT